jgi:hypothetical protein
MSANSVLCPSHKSFGIGNFDFVGPYMYIWADIGRYFLTKFIDALFEYGHAFGAVHRESECCEEVVAMTGHIYFGYHQDATLSGIVEDVAYLVVCIVAALVATGSLEAAVVELRVGTTFYTPCGFIGEMPLKYVKLIG